MAVYAGKQKVLDGFSAGSTRPGQAKPIIAYGARVFPHTGKGEVSVPVKRVHRVCEKHYRTVYVPEHLTTKVHLDCGQRLNPIARGAGGEQGKGKEEEGKEEDKVDEEEEEEEEEAAEEEKEEKDEEMEGEKDSKVRKLEEKRKWEGGICGSQCNISTSTNTSSRRRGRRRGRKKREKNLGCRSSSSRPDAADHTGGSRRGTSPGSCRRRRRGGKG